MTTTLNLSKMFTEKEIRFSWKFHFSEVSFDIRVPDLSQNRYSVFGDWGPNYTVNVDPEKLVKVSVGQGGQTKTYFLENSTVEFKSPLLKEERDVHPLYLELEDKAHDMIYQVYLDHEGLPNRAKLLEKKDRRDLGDIILS